MEIDGYLEPLGRCEACGLMFREGYLTEFLGDLLCPDDLETAEEEFELVE